MKTFLSIKELITFGHTGYIMLNMTLSELISKAGEPEYINRHEDSLKLIGVGYENDYFSFSKNELLIAYTIKFRDLEKEPEYNNKSIYYDYLECKIMTRKEWFQFFKKHGFKNHRRRRVKDKHEYFTSYYASNPTEDIEYALCHSTDRILFLSCIYRQGVF